MNQPVSETQEAVPPPPLATASSCGNAPVCAVLPPSTHGTAAKWNGRDAFAKGQRLASREIFQKRRPEEGAVRTKGDTHTNISDRLSNSSALSVATTEVHSRSNRASPQSISSASVIPSAAGLVSTLTISSPSITIVKSLVAKVPQTHHSHHHNSTSKQSERASRARGSTLRPRERGEGAPLPREVTPKLDPLAPLLGSEAASPSRVVGASTLLSFPPSPLVTSACGIHDGNSSVSCNSSCPETAAAGTSSPPTRSSVKAHLTHADLMATGGTSSRGSSNDPPRVKQSFIVPNRHRRSMAEVLLPTQQLLDEGYYLASDSSANSSFSDTPRSARRVSLGSSSSADAPRQPLYLNSSDPASGDQSTAVTIIASPRDLNRLGDIRDPKHHSTLEEKGAVTFNRNEEETALAYMSTEGGARPSGNPSLSKYVVSATLAGQKSFSPGKAGKGPIDDSCLLGLSGGVRDTVRIGEGPPNCMSASWPPNLRRLQASPQRHATLSAICSPSADKSAPPSSQPPLCSSHVYGALPNPTTITETPSTLLPQRSPANTPALSRRNTLTSVANHESFVTMLSPHSSAFSALMPPPSRSGEEPVDQQCRQLSLHEAFFTNQSRTAWLVDDHVLAKVLEYVRIMGYEHPALKRDRIKGQSSLWSSSSAIPSPVLPGRPRETPKTPQSMGASSSHTTAEPAVDALTLSNSAVTPPSLATGASGAAAPVGRRYYLRTEKPTCAAQSANTPTATAAGHLFLTFSEAMRWVAEQEYFIGAVLMCCARFVGDAAADGLADIAAWPSRRGMMQQKKPCIPIRFHPIHFIVLLVRSQFPQWGNMATFTRAWETQVRLVLASASPSHQRLFKFPDTDLVLSSDCEAGNLHRVERTAEPYLFLIWLEPDQGSDKRIWFRFSVAGAVEGCTLRFRLMNAAPHVKLYRQNGMVPVWRDGLDQPHWGAVDSCTFRTTNRDLVGEVCFSVTARNSTETIQIAFCAPYTYADLLCHVCHWHDLVKHSRCSIRFEERVLGRSPDGRKLHLLIVTSRPGGAPASKKNENKMGKSTALAVGRREHAGLTSDGVTEAAGGPFSGWVIPGSVGPTIGASSGKGKVLAVREVVCGPYANFASGKKVVLVSGRVHPGEVTASHGVHGLISFLLSSDARAIQLRKHFIFFIVPMLNPDSVSRGHSRMDQFGNNLNRCYKDPDEETQPTVLALRRVFEHLQYTYRERFIMYLDFHSHASQSSGFIFGNNLPVSVQHWNLFFPRLVELHARHVFSYGLCRFGRSQMTTKDGSSRVLFGNSLIHSYTVELTHFTDRRLYADSFTAMNNGSRVLFETTWPPLHQTAGQTGGTNGNEGGEQAAVRSGANETRGSITSSHPVNLRPTSGMEKASKRLQSSYLGRGRTCRSTPKDASTRTTGNSMYRKSGDTATRSRRGAGATGAGEHSGGQSSPSQTGSARTAPLLQPISTPTVLCQSAEVGQACLLALLDYCCIGASPSPELTLFGGMESVLRASRRQVQIESTKKGNKSQPGATNSGMRPIYKQY